MNAARDPSPEPLFDRADEYDAMLHQGLRLSGEDKTFFQRGRLADLRRQLPPGFEPSRVLDFGCGLGDTTTLLAAAFPSARLVGVDTAAPAIAHARATRGSERIAFATVDELAPEGNFDLAYTNGVFHHIEPRQRPAAARRILQCLKPGGLFALFENNPLNPGTRLVMSRIEFDRDAEPFRAGSARRLLRQAGFQLPSSPRYLFVYPRPLAWLRFSEPWLTRLPLGGQYWVMGRRPAGGGPRPGSSS